MKKTITKFLTLLSFSATLNAQTGIVETFDTFTLSPNSYYQNNSSDNWEGNINQTIFEYGWNTSFGGYWESGSAYTNVQDTTTGDFSNLYGASTYSAHSGSNYATIQNNSIIKIKYNDAIVQGFYITNTTFAYKSIKNGDSFARKFGDTTGTNSGGMYAQGEYPDWFSLTINGYQNGVFTNTMVVYLADYRATGTANDYVLNTWQYVNCNSLNTVDSISFTLNSSDVGQFGMNTPAFFAIDDFDIAITTSVNELQSVSIITTYPNPVNNNLTLNFTSKTNDEYKLEITNVNGDVVFETKAQLQIGKNNTIINTSNFDAGIYFVKLINGSQIKNTKFIKQ